MALRIASFLSTTLRCFQITHECEDALSILASDINLIKYGFVYMAIYHEGTRAIPVKYCLLLEHQSRQTGPGPAASEASKYFPYSRYTKHKPIDTVSRKSPEPKPSSCPAMYLA